MPNYYKNLIKVLQKLNKKYLYKATFIIYNIYNNIFNKHKHHKPS